MRRIPVSVSSENTSTSTSSDVLHTAVTRASQDDQVADLDRMEELQAVDRRRHEQAAGVPVAGDRAGDVDEVHDRAAEDEPERVGVVRAGRPAPSPGRGLSRRARFGDRSIAGSSCVDERLQRAAQLRREIVVADRVEEGDRRLVGLQLRDAARARGEVAFELRVDVRRQLVLDVVREEPDEVGAAPFRPGVSALMDSAPSFQLPASRAAQ